VLDDDLNALEFLGPFLQIEIELNEMFRPILEKIFPRPDAAGVRLVLLSKYPTALGASPEVGCASRY
jgi:hypothetical protein